MSRVNARDGSRSKEYQPLIRTFLIPDTTHNETSETRSREEEDARIVRREHVLESLSRDVVLSVLADAQADEEMHGRTVSGVAC